MRHERVRQKQMALSRRTERTNCANVVRPSSSNSLRRYLGLIAAEMSGHLARRADRPARRSCSSRVKKGTYAGPNNG